MLFNVRVYGILINDKQEILVSDEMIQGKMYTKFPGGGMEYGEGTRGCLEREFGEEMNMEITTGDHIYTTDFFQESAFKAHDQLVAIYYYVYPKEQVGELKKHVDTPAEFTKGNPHASSEIFRFVSLKDLNQDMMSFPVDKVVVGLLKK